MDKHDDNEQKILKIFKHQENQLDTIKSLNIETNTILDESINKAESLLKELGIDINNIKNKEILKNLHLDTPELIKQRAWDDIVSEAEKNIDFQVSFKDLLTQQEINKCISKVELLRTEFQESNDANCDKYDYLIAALCGSLGGLIDVLFVGLPGQGSIGKLADNQGNHLVQKFAEFSGWNKEKAIDKGSDLTKSAIGFLERNFKVNYDHPHGGAVGNLFKMSTKNHHVKSLAHSPSIVGLFFSILNQLTNTASFVSDGKVITIDTETYELQGSNLISKIFSGFVNWIGHIISDMSGSSGAVGRGSGVPIPFYELLQFINVGSFGEHRKTFAEISVMVFQEGYDFRHGVALTYPILFTEISTRFFWILKSKFYHKRTWKDSVQNALPLRKNSNLQRMLFSAYGCFCLIDITEAAVTSGVVVVMLSKMNIVAWFRWSTLGIQEFNNLLRRSEKQHDYVMNKLNNEWLTLNESINITIKLASGTYEVIN